MTQGEFTSLDTSIAYTIFAGLVKYKKYYNLMDAQDAYYVALILDPRFKTILLEKELDEEATAAVIKGIKELLHQQYPLDIELQEYELIISIKGEVLKLECFGNYNPKRRSSLI
jgi:hypothetical protein